MAVLWITLPHSWSLQDTQAGLNVIIAFLCAGGIFVLVRSFWVSAARRVARDKEVPVYSLLSLNTIGETLDVVWLLRKELLTGRYIGLLIQCVGVLLLTACTVLSGFIARFSARETTMYIERAVPGTLAQRAVESTYFSSMELDAALSALRRAGVPHDELFDFWPDPSSQWQFAPGQWTNHSWSMDCKYTPLMALVGDLRATNGSCQTDFSGQLPFLNDIWDDGAMGYPMRYGINIWNDRPTMTRSGIIFGFGDQLFESSWDESLRVLTKMNFRMSMMFLDGPITDLNYTAPGKCMYEVGPLSRAVFTTTTCELTRNTNYDKMRSDGDIQSWGAFPETDHGRVLDVLLEYYGNNWLRELWSAKPVTIVDGKEMALFYQAFSIARDTRGFLYDNSTSGNVITTRILNVPVQAPQVSLKTVVFCSVGALFVLAGLINYLHFMLTHRKRFDRTPQSKLDWMLHTLKHENNADALGLGQRHRFRETLGLGMGHHHPHDHNQPELVELSKGDDYDHVNTGYGSHGPATSVTRVD